MEVYRDEADNPLLPNGRIPQGWVIFLNSYPDPKISGYYGSAYLHIASKSLVIAHRGTNDLNDVYNDALLSALEEATIQYFQKAIPFVDDVKQLFKSQYPLLNPQQYIAHTGHSLGAFLAELCATRDKVKAVTFDSPGSRQNIENLIERGQLPTDSITWADNNVINFLAAPDVVNTANYHVGKLYRVYSEYAPVDVLEQPANPYYFAYFSLTNQHSMKGIYQQFLPNTDLPKTYSLPTTWPTGTLVKESGYNSYKNYDDNPYYWERYMKHRWEMNPVVNAQNVVVYLHDVYSSYDAYHQDFIKNNLNSDPTASQQTGVTLTGDNSGNDIWGTTAKKDIVNSGTGNDIHHDFGGDDEYHDLGGTDIYRFKPNNGHDIIDDSDGKGEIIYGGVSLAGVARRTTGDRFVLEVGLNTAVLQPQGGDMVITVNEAPEGAENSITIRDFTSGKLGITTQENAYTEQFVPRNAY